MAASSQAQKTARYVPIRFDFVQFELTKLKPGKQHAYNDQAHNCLNQQAVALTLLRHAGYTQLAPRLMMLDARPPLIKQRTEGQTAEVSDTPTSTCTYIELYIELEKPQSRGQDAPEHR